jgi:hypothetical protein
MRKTNAAYQSKVYTKNYKKAIRHSQEGNNINTVLKEKYWKWQIVFRYVYMLWVEGCQPLYTENFYKGITLEKFKKLWCDKIDVVDRIFCLLDENIKRGFKKIN